MNLESSDSEKNVSDATNPELKEKLAGMVATVDTGARNLQSWSGWILASVALCWSLFQLWIASPFPYIFSDIIIEFGILFIALIKETEASSF